VGEAEARYALLSKDNILV
jgi:hypothetical protein